MATRCRMFAKKSIFNVYRHLNYLSCINKGNLPNVVSVCFGQKRCASTMPTAAKYGGRHTVTLIPGDGIGPELMVHVKDVFRYAGAPIDFEEFLLSGEREDAESVEQAIIAVKRNGVALKGNVHTNLDTLQINDKSDNVTLRKNLDLFANVIHCKSYPGIKTRHDDIDIVVIRENTEGEYSSLEHENVDGVVESLKIITHAKSKRIAEYAFDYARSNGRKKVTAVHKANIMKLGDGLFLQTCRDVASANPDIEFEDMIVDNCCMQMVSNPSQFDVMVMPNLYGNIVGNIGAGLVGGPGIVPGQNLGDRYSVFETATRNTGKTIAGLNMANPTAMLLASCQMLDHLNLNQHAALIRNSVMETLTKKENHTPDLGGQATTREVIQSIIDQIELTGKGSHM
ncbi:isocitrate dehydrogenase [NAD] subunit gamma, mitochondrial-like isoform X2 [Anneissia japonica]|uniref:isocitrate dehydrogenase [NAD] subunit gamma, mitochondrial-like isoform X2 n=1 Tax=Anneissia japonica TaxID=1529436 RepID=UPI0014254F7B|nr:isocitrate dehydrogenase [NAD] subunit gamma, mitochondrial-like isoform X2 [Anneissia japonica]